jgi:lipid A ethanolaminephosphotransferase
LKKINSFWLILISSISLSTFYNYSFWQNVLEVYPFGQNWYYLISLFILISSIIGLIFALLNSKYTLKPFLILIILGSTFAGYFMDSYGVIIDDHMLQNALETNNSEVYDLITLKLFVYFFFFGLLPSFLIYKVKIYYQDFKKELILKLQAIFLFFGLIVVMLFSFSTFYTSFFREHKSLRYYTNPTYYIYSVGKYLNNKFATIEEFKQIGLDAKNISKDTKPKLLIIVVGEAARAASFSLNGYKNTTNPNLALEDIINYQNATSCGTETAVSVPCMFSIYNRTEYTDSIGKASENVLDVLNHAKINLLWRDNNSNSKGVADRITYEDLNSATDEELCSSGECFDEILLKDLQKYVDKQTGDTVIVLHQKGSHGPAYYKRYPKEFKKFTPICESNQLEFCTQEQIQNSYDNTILYTDYFLSKTINFLKENQKSYQTALIYSADHGESLGENGVYLHGMPYLLAPDFQTHIGFFQWFGDDFKKTFDINCLKKNSVKEVSHDNLFHSILGIMEIDTTIYDKNFDIFSECKK